MSLRIRSCRIPGSRQAPVRSAENRDVDYRDRTDQPVSLATAQVLKFSLTEIG